jgi:flagellar protein FlaJ
MDLKKYVHEFVFISIAVVLLLINFLFLIKTAPFIVPIVNVTAILIAVVPPFYIFYSRYLRARDIERKFIVFIMDLTEGIDSGMTLPMALKYVSEKDYGALNPYVKEINSKVSWGVPFEDSLKIFAKKVGSLPIKRAVTTIIESYKVGGNISDTLKAVGSSLTEIEKIKRERSASIHSEIVTCYLIFFVFIFILIVLEVFLIPALGRHAPAGGESESIKIQIEPYMLVNFIIVQGFFAGLAVGKIAEGSIIAGLKHSIVLIVAGYLIFSLASNIRIFF